MKNKHPVLRRFMRRKVSVVAAAVLILFVLIAILGPLVWQVDPLKQSVMKKYGPMTVQHPLGTDNLGRDTLARMIYGARVSLAISFAGVLSGALIGVLLGVSAGYFGGWVDAIISRFIDILLAFPGLLLAITIVAVLGPGSVNTVIAITIFTIPGLTRMVRSVVLSLKSSEYVEACKTMGRKQSAHHLHPRHPELHVPDYRQRDAEPWHGDSDGFVPVVPRLGRDAAGSRMGRNAVADARSHPHLPHRRACPRYCHYAGGHELLAGGRWSARRA